jgi:hypothetical protein
MKRTYYYGWRFHVDGPATTLHHFSAEDFRHQFPNAADATPLERHPRISQEPESAEEERDMWAEYYWSLEPEDRETVAADVIGRYKLDTHPRRMRNLL